MENTRLQKLASLIGDTHVAFLTTVSSGGALRSRPMATQKFARTDAFEGTLYFLSSMDSAKVREAQREHAVSVNYVTSGNTYIALSGQAIAYRDVNKVRELWSPFVKAWFPQGPEDPDIAVIRVVIDHAEYWEGPSSKIMELFGVAKASITGKPPTDLADHQAFDVH